MGIADPTSYRAPATPVTGVVLLQDRRWKRLLSAGAALALGAAAPLAGAAADITDPEGTIIVTARRLNAARAAIQPQLGASVYTVDKAAIAALPGGDNLGLNQVVLQSPGVAQDSFGQLHVRGEHNGLQFRLNGVILPEGLNVFSQALSPRLADKVALITGALPAQYGLRTAGIVDITTRNGVYQNAGEVGVYGGSHGQIQPSISYGGGGGPLNVFVSGSYEHTGLGIESPDGRSTPAHDLTDQFQGFAYLEDIVDPSSRVSLILGASNERFQLPDRPGLTPSLMFGPNGDQPLVVDGQTTFPSLALNQSQKEATYFGVASFLHTTDAFTGQVSLFARYSRLTFTPDPIGDLLFDGIAQAARKQDTAGGIQAEGVYHLGEAHTLRGGVIVQVDRAASATTSQVIPLDPSTGGQTSDQPISIIDNGSRTALTASIYLQDEWRLADALILNYGLRFDQFDGFRHENQLSPRVNLVWTPTRTITVHAGFSRYFSPPPFELVGAKRVGLFNNTTSASAVTLDDTPYAERANYFDVGVSQRITRRLTLGVDSYYKRSKNLIDEGQFGAPIIETPFNYAQGRQYGVELTANYNEGPLTTYANLALAKNQGEDIHTSQFNFSAADLAYIQNHFIFLDHNQGVSASAGASYLWRGTRIGGDLIVGGGLRTTAPGGAPNGAHLPAYAEVNLSLSHQFDEGPLRGISARFDVVNALDHVYEIRDGSGVGVGAPQFGARRGFFGGVTKSF